VLVEHVMSRKASLHTHLLGTCKPMR
jgi:hypothetical protein